MNAKTIDLAPIRQSTIVSTSREKAFDLFTGRMSEWWFGQGIGPTPFEQIVLEGRRGGRWFERAPDGTETDWGEVVAWERPARLLLAWRINGEWKFDPELETALEITFQEIDANSTRLVLEHRDLGRLGESGRKTAEAMNSGWASLLERFAALVRRHQG
jgi:uncharacterized protein YndB with AHSA1/START domain